MPRKATHTPTTSLLPIVRYPIKAGESFSLSQAAGSKAGKDRVVRVSNGGSAAQLAGVMSSQGGKCGSCDADGGIGDAGGFRGGRLERRLDTTPYFYYSGTMETKAAVAALGALAQESRLEVFRLLVQRGTAGLPAGEIGERVGVPATTLSFHLAQLSHAGLVTSRREGRSIIYAADYAGMRALMDFLTRNCCQGLCAPEAPEGRVTLRKKSR